MNVQTTQLNMNNNEENDLGNVLKNKIINQYANNDFLNNSSDPTNNNSPSRDFNNHDYILNTDGNQTNTHRNRILNRDAENFPNLPININSPKLISKKKDKNNNNQNQSQKKLANLKKPFNFQSPKILSANFENNNMNNNNNKSESKKIDILNTKIHKALNNKENKEIDYINTENKDKEKPPTPLKVKFALADIFDKKLGLKINMIESPHKKKIESFNVNMNELQRFCFGDKILSEETEEEKRGRIAEQEKKNHSEFLLKDMKKKVFFMKNVIDHVYPKVIVSKVNSLVEQAKEKNRNLLISPESKKNRNNNNKNFSSNNNEENNFNNYENINTENIRDSSNLKDLKEIKDRNILNNLISPRKSNSKNLENIIESPLSPSNINRKNNNNTNNINNNNTNSLDPNDYYILETDKTKYQKKIEALRKKSKNVSKKLNNLNNLNSNNLNLNINLNSNNNTNVLNTEASNLNFSEFTDSIFHPEFTSIINKNIIEKSSIYKTTDNSNTNHTNNLTNNNNNGNNNKSYLNNLKDFSRNPILFSVNTSKDTNSSSVNNVNKKENKEKKIDFVTDLLAFNSKISDLNAAIKRKNTEDNLNMIEKKRNKNLNRNNNLLSLDEINNSKNDTYNTNNFEGNNETLGNSVSINSPVYGNNNNRKKIRTLSPMKIVNLQKYELNPLPVNSIQLNSNNYNK